MLPKFFITALILFTAVIFDHYFQELPTALHPAGWQGRMISAMWKIRPDGRPYRLLLHGLLIVVFGTAATFLIVSTVENLLQKLIRIIYIIVSALILRYAMSFRRLTDIGRRIAGLAETKNLTEARKELAYHLVSRNTDDLNSSQIISAVIESLAENFTDSVISPLFYFASGGLPAAWAFRFCNTADAMLGYRDTDREWGGKIPARTDDLLNWIPARYAGLAVTAASAFTGLSVRNAFRQMRLGARQCSSPNSGWTMAAAAGALGIRLEKPGCYVLNASARAPEPADVRTLIRLLRRALIFSIPGLILFALSLDSISGLLRSGTAVPQE